MSRTILIAFVVSLAVCCTSAAPSSDSQCQSGAFLAMATACEGKCPEAIDNSDNCSFPDIMFRCVCKPGYFETTEGLCVFEQACH